MALPNEVLQALRGDSVKKDVVIHFPGREHPDITNANLVEESIDFTESICSRESIIFGLCESSQFNFEAFDIGDIEGLEFEARHNVEIDNYSKTASRSLTTTWASGATVGVNEYFLFKDYSGNPSVTEGNTGEETNNRSYYYLEGFDVMYSDSIKKVLVTVTSSESNLNTYSRLGFVEFEDGNEMNRYSHPRYLPDEFDTSAPLAKSDHLTYTITKNDFEEDFRFTSLMISNCNKETTIQVSINIEFEKWSFLYGKFRVDSCTTTKDNPRIRKVKSYNTNSEPMKTFSNIEYTKMTIPLPTETEYEIDFAKSALASIPGFESVYFKYEKVNPSEESNEFIFSLEKYDTSMGDHRVEIEVIVTTENKIYNESDDILYHYSSSELNDSIDNYYNSILDVIVSRAAKHGDTITITDEEKEKLKTQLSCCVYPYAKFMNLTDLTYYYVTDGLSNGCVYPYISGASFTFVMPKDIIVKVRGVKGSGTSEEDIYTEQKYYTAHESTALYKVTCEEYFDIYKMSFEREKNEYGKGYLPNVDAIWSPYEFIQGLFEIYGSFGKYYPDGSFREFFLDSGRNTIWKKGVIDLDTGIIDDKGKNELYTEPIECHKGDVVTLDYAEIATSEETYLVMILFYKSYYANPDSLIWSTNQKNPVAPEGTNYIRVIVQKTGITSTGLKVFINKDAIAETYDYSDWYEGNMEYGKAATLPYAYVACTYTNLEEEESYGRYWLVDQNEYSSHMDKYQAYTLGDNYLIQNMQYSAEAIQVILKRIGDHLAGLTYYPISVKTRGLLNVRAGDRIKIKVNGEYITTYVLRRNLKGIDLLEDSIGDGVGGGGSYSGNVNRSGSTSYAPGGGGGGGEETSNLYVSAVTKLTTNNFSVTVTNKDTGKKTTNVYAQSKDGDDYILTNQTNGLKTVFKGW